MTEKLLEVKGFKEGSKGDVILVAPNEWIFLVNFPYKTFQQVVRELQKRTAHSEYWILDTLQKSIWFIETIKVNEKRHYRLAKLHRIEGITDFTRWIDEKEDRGLVDTYESDSLKAEKYVTVERSFRFSGDMAFVIPPTGEIYEHLEVKEKKQTWEKEKVRVEYEVRKEDDTLCKLIRRWEDWKANEAKYSGHFGFDVLLEDGTYFYTLSDRILFEKFEAIDEQTLLELSKYYIITIPVMRINDTLREAKFASLPETNRTMHVVNIYYDGRKMQVVLKASELPEPLKLGIRRRRFALSKYAMLKLPYGERFESLFSFNEFAELVRAIKQEVDKLKVRVKEVDRRKQFEEIFFIKSPKRKLKLIDDYLIFYERFRDYADKAVLFMVFYGQEGEWKRFFPNYKAFRIEDGRITVETKPPVGITTLCLKGGKFEEAYKDVFNLKRILRFHYSERYADRAERFELLKEHVDEVRKAVEPMVKEDAKFEDYVRAIHKIAESVEHPDNVILCLCKYFKEARKDEWTKDWEEEVSSAIRILAGFVKSGKDYDYTHEKLDDVFRILRVALLWTMKVRGYSPVNGVMLSGTPEQIAEGVARFVRGLKGRELALARELESSLEEIKAEIGLERVKILAEEVG